MKVWITQAAAALVLGFALQSAAQAQSAYKIQPGDVLQVAVVGLPDFQYKSVVNLEGAVTLPMLAPVKVAGLDLQADVHVAIGELA